MKEDLLTPKERTVLSFMKKFAQNNGGNFPKKSHIQSHFNYKSNNSVTQFFASLEEKGILSWLDSAKKFYKINSEELNSPNLNIRAIQIEGLVSAGILKEAVSNPEVIELSTNMLNSSKEYFALKVSGDSMIGDHIIDGDIVVLEKSTEVASGSIAVVQAEGSATIKRVFFKSGKIELVASNPSYQPIIIKNDPSFRILGKLHTVVRRVEIV